jgi:hypothetical protein
MDAEPTTEVIGAGEVAATRSRYPLARPDAPLGAIRGDTPERHRNRYDTSR